ncbi:MAG: AAA family ATPase, partial [Vicinamibacterales bacterium]
RKRRFGVTPETRLGSESYTPEVNRDVYAALVARTSATLAAGYSAIADAVFADPEHRAAIEQAARDAAVPFAGLWLQAPPETLRARVASRLNDASDATAKVIDRQVANTTAPSGWHVLDATTPEDETAASANAYLA